VSEGVRPLPALPRHLREADGTALL